MELVWGAILWWLMSYLTHCGAFALLRRQGLYSSEIACAVMPYSFAWQQVIRSEIVIVSN
jgi:hypothetical protein